MRVLIQKKKKHDTKWKGKINTIIFGNIFMQQNNPGKKGSKNVSLIFRWDNYNFIFSLFSL